MTDAEKLADQYWRLNNLYWIQDKDGRRVKFKLNRVQERLYNERGWLNLILKARQHGMTTLIDLIILDTALFRPDTACGIIAHNLVDAEQIFRLKIKYPYDNLPSGIRANIRADTSRSNMMAFSNGSSIRVSTSYRSGTLQILHVSEFGKIAAQNPARATEIVTGAFEAVASGSLIFVESTAEGRDGEFYRLSERARKHSLSGQSTGPMDWKFHFYPWFVEPGYRAAPQGVTIPISASEYFSALKLRGIELDDAQKAWYVKKTETLGDKMKREYPSFPEEAFEAAVKGAYFGSTIDKMRAQHRICRVPYDEILPVHTCWDLGMDDYTSIWFFQSHGTEIRLIDYYSNNGEGMAFYSRILRDKSYNYGYHYLPHDARARSIQTNKTTVEIAESVGIRPVVVVERAKNEDELLAAIEETRVMLSKSWIDEEHCAEGIKALENYRKKWDEKLGCFTSRPLHDENSHGSDALRTGAVGFKGEIEIDQADLLPEWSEDF